MDPTPGWNITLDIAAALSALVWPLAVLGILLAYRRSLPEMMKGIAGRVRKLGFAGVSLELAEAKQFSPEWSSATGALDLRSQASAMQVNDSTQMLFTAQLLSPGSADYALVNLGAGEEWLNTRLYIMAILFARMKGLKALVFLETSQNVRKRYLGWAEPEKVRWALARCYPWLETQYADAYSQVMGPMGQNVMVVSNLGRLGYSYDPNSGQASVNLLQEFLKRVQSSPVPPVPPPPGTPGSKGQWMLIDPANSTYEQAEWLASEDVENILGEDLHIDSIRSGQLMNMQPAEQLRAFLNTPGKFVALTAEDGRFQHLVWRDAVLEQAVEQIAHKVEN